MDQTSELVGGKLFDMDSMVNSTPSCLKVITCEGKLLNMNPRGLDMIEADSLESVLGADVFDLIDPSYKEAFRRFNERVCRGQKGSLIFELIGLKGTRRWMETHAAPYELANGEMGHIAITNDITDRIEAENKIKIQKQALEDSSRLAALGQFVGGIAHEINNPLSIILARSTMLRKRVESGDLDQEFIQKSTQQIDETVERISEIIKNLRYFSRDSKNDEMKICSLLDVVKKTLALCHEKFGLAGVRVDIDIDVTHQVECRDVQISQILMNLLNNSYDAILDADEKWIKIKSHQEGQKTLLTFTDSGRGIPGETASQMMNPFYTTKDVGKGTGLGLSISSSIMKDHDGELRYNKDSSNTQFLLEFPLVQG